MKLKMIAAFLLIIVFTATFYSQSGRVTQTEKTDLTKQVTTAVQTIICDENVEFKYFVEENVKDFLAELNRLGQCGYRLEYITKYLMGDFEQTKDIDLIAIVKLNAGTKYEYDWFEAQSGFEAAEQMNQKAEKGFYYRKNVHFVIDRCDLKKSVEKRRSEESSSVPGVIEHSREVFAPKGSIYFVERKNGVVKKNEYRTLSASLGFGEKSDREIQPKFDEQIAQNFHPVAINYSASLTQYSVLMEKDGNAVNENEYRFIREEFGYKNKINQLAKEGFAPILSGINFAVLQRNKKNSPAYSFVAADNYRSITKMLSKTLKEGGAYFSKGLSDYPCVEPLDNYIFVGKPLIDDGIRYEYKMLSMNNVWNLRKGEAIILKPSKEKTEQFNAMLESGYQIRELFTAGEIVVLFERKINRSVKF